MGPDGRVYHSHDGLAPHSHEPIYSPGYFSRRAPPLINRDFNERAFTIGIGGPVGTGYIPKFPLVSLFGLVALYKICILFTVEDVI